MHKTFSLTDRFLFVLTSYLPFLIFLWVFQMLNGVVLCTTFIATLLFLFLQTTKLKKWVIPIYGALIMLLLLSLIINFRDTINAIYNQITSVYAHSSNYDTITTRASFLIFTSLDSVVSDDHVTGIPFYHSLETSFPSLCHQLSAIFSNDAV